MTDTLATGAANAPEGLAAPEAASSVVDANSTAAPELASPEASAPIASGAPADSPPAGDPQSASPGNRVPARDRIAELVAERNFWRDRAVAPPVQPAQAAPVAPQAPPAPPTLDQFDYDTEKWAQAHAKWTNDEIDRRAAAVVDQRLSAQRDSETRQTTQQTFVAREAEFAGKTPGYYDAVSDPRLAQLTTPTIAEIVSTSEHGPALSFHLATHTDELARIAQLPPARQAAALGRLEAQLTSTPSRAAPAAASRPVTRAPAPPTPVGGSVPPSKSIEDMPIDEYMAHRQAWANRS